jgi:hypothetical protein
MCLCAPSCTCNIFPYKLDPQKNSNVLFYSSYMMFIKNFRKIGFSFTGSFQSCISFRAFLILNAMYENARNKDYVSRRRHVIKLGVIEEGAY